MCLDALRLLVDSDLHFCVTPEPHHLHNAVLGSVQAEASEGT